MRMMLLEIAEERFSQLGAFFRGQERIGLHAVDHPLPL